MLHFKLSIITILIFNIYIILSEIAFSQSYQCGISWSEVKQISGDSVLSISPQFSVSNNKIHIIWFGIDTLGNQGHDGIQYSRSLDNGISFQNSSTIVPATSAFSPGNIESSGHYVYVTYTGLIDRSFGTLFIRSTDDGETWEMPQNLLPQTQPILMTSSGSLVLIHFIVRLGEYGLIKSEDYGSTWEVVNSSMPLMNDLHIKDNLIYAVGTVDFGHYDEVGYYYSTNGGLTWIGPQIISNEDIISSLYPKISIFDDGTKIISWNDNGKIITRRSDGYDEEEDELIWEPPSMVHNGGDAVFSDIATQNNTALIVWDVNRSDSNFIQYQQITDYGKTLCNFSTMTIKEAGEASVNIQGNTAFVLWSGESNSGREIFFQYGTLNPDTLPVKFSLNQNYPNPANEITNIEYEIARPGYVHLNLYNLLGQKIANIVDGFQEQNRYKVTLNCSIFPSGVYFYRIITRYYVETMKMTIVK